MYHGLAQLHQAAAEHGHTGKRAGVVGIYLQTPWLVTTLHQAPNETFVELSGAFSGKFTQQLYP